MAKNPKIDKDTRRLMESIADLIKVKDGVYKFKTKKKKQIRKIKTTCVHWMINKKGKPVTTVVKDPSDSRKWKCNICGATFPCAPLSEDECIRIYDNMMAGINQAEFLGLKMGGDSEDTKIFLTLKRLLPQYLKMQKVIIKKINKMKMADNMLNSSNSLNQFENMDGYNYK